MKENPENNKRSAAGKNTGDPASEAALLHTANESPGSRWTDAQRRAIAAGGRDILVAAGAGSGKTRVLVERILQRITGEAEMPRMDIDCFLVVTFTNAAAAEMKHRIAGGLKKILSRSPGDAHVRRQLLLLNRAHISTIHSFCMDVIRRYSYLRRLDAAFRIVDENEAELLRYEALEELLEKRYEENDPGSPFYRLIDLFSTDRGDQALQDLVLRLHDFSRSHPSPESWLREQAGVFASLEPGGKQASPWETVLLQQAFEELSGIVRRLEKALELAGYPGGPEPYLDNLEEDLAAVRRALDASSRCWEELTRAVHAPAFGRLKACRGDRFDPGLKDRVTALRNSSKEDFLRLKENYFQRPLEEQREELQHLSPAIGALVDLVRDFGEEYEQVKKEKSLADFPDLEHRALQLLTDPESNPNAPEPSEAARDYRKQFAEILVDEYQDINPVQEAILQRVASPAPGGNRFMVGDVKQSIYRFRLAEPVLFQEKHRSFHREMDADAAGGGSSPGECIVLSRNFRSREEILDSVNDLFSQVMDENVGEVNYDKEAELHRGTEFLTSSSPVEFCLIDREGTGTAPEAEQELDPNSTDAPAEDVAGNDEGLEELGQTELEGRFIAGKIRELMGLEGGEPLEIYDREENRVRPVRYRDIVILLRSARGWAPAVLESLGEAGIPAYVDLGTGYFSATEVEVILSLLKVIDNPYQDIPLGAVLRSPLVGLDAGEMAEVRAAAPAGSFFEAVKACSRKPEKIRLFLDRLYRWQDMARQDSLAVLIWEIYRETGYYDFTGGLPGGRQRQANLRALYDRARQYEAARFRGLFRFLRFIDKVRERGGDLGEARALGEQENLVRIMTVHKSKGLEFPVVFTAGLGKSFNLQDVSGHFLVHKSIGFGPRYLDLEKRVSYPTLAWHAVRQRLILETLSEEMRILYVAMTRAEERLFLVGSVRNAQRAVQRWIQAARGAETLLPVPDRARGRSALDWIGPALLRHPDAGPLRALCPEEEGLAVEGFCSSWKMLCISPAALQPEKPEETAETEKAEAVTGLGPRIARLEPLDGEGGFAAEVKRRLDWQYPYRRASRHFAKLSVSELKKVLSAGLSRDDAGEADGSSTAYARVLQKRPAFLGRQDLSPGERGSAYHTAMQHLSFTAVSTSEEISRQLDEMLEKDILTPEEREAVDAGLIFSFFQCPLGRRVLSGKEVFREVPFSLAVPLSELYTREPGGGQQQAQAFENREEAAEDEALLVQGVIDCLVLEDGRFVLIDFKTGSTTSYGFDTLLEHYRIQLNYYARAVEQIWQGPVSQCFLYFFDDQQALEIERPPCGVE